MPFRIRPNEIKQNENSAPNHTMLGGTINQFTSIHWNNLLLLLVIVVVPVDTIWRSNASVGRMMTQRTRGRVIIVSDAQQVIHFHHCLKNQVKLPSSHQNHGIR